MDWCRLLAAATTQEYHILPDLTQLVLAISGAVIGFLTTWPVFLSKIHKIQMDSQSQISKVREDMASLKTQADMNTSQLDKNQVISNSQVMHLGDSISRLSLSVVPTTAIIDKNTSKPTQSVDTTTTPTVISTDKGKTDAGNRTI
jgi:hypothetical protein